VLCASQFFHFKGSLMLEQQLKRLQEDSAQLEIFANELRKEGKQDLAKKVIVKKQYIESYISSKKTELVTTH